MIVVIFEFEVKKNMRQRYIDLATRLKPELEKINGFISVDRYISAETPDKLLSISLWRDQNAVDIWYKHAGHHDAQKEGKETIFKDYRICVASVLREHTLAEDLVS